MALAMVATFFAIQRPWAMIPLRPDAAGTYAARVWPWAICSEWLGAASAAAGPQIMRSQPLQLLQLPDRLIQAETGSFPLA
jgi:hypothetical protein